MYNPDRDEQKEIYINEVLTDNGLAIEEGIEEDLSNVAAAADLLKELDKMDSNSED